MIVCQRQRWWIYSEPNDLGLVCLAAFLTFSSSNRAVANVSIATRSTDSKVVGGRLAARVEEWCKVRFDVIVYC